MLFIDAARNMCRIYQFYVIISLLQAQLRIRVFMKVSSLYGELFPEGAAYSGKSVMSGEAMCDMTLSGKHLYEELRDWLILVGFIQSDTCPLIFTRYEPDDSFLRIVFYIDDALYFASSEGALDRLKK
jgi:hypothetical protein